MALQTELFQKLMESCRISHRQQQWQQKKQELEARLPQAKADKREAEVALTEYECGGLRTWLDKRSGKFQEKLDHFSRNVSNASSALENLKLELARTQGMLEDLDAQEKGLNLPGEIPELAQQLPAEERALILGVFARGLAMDLLAMLEQAKTALEEAQQWARPNNRIDTAPGYTKGKLLAQAEDCARTCAERMDEMGKYGMALEVHPYFLNPAGYIHAVATPYAELDRINSAIGAIRQTEKQIQQLLQQLPEEEQL